MYGKCMHFLQTHLTIIILNFISANASCENIRCRKGKRCLIDPNGGPPRCVTCPKQCKLPRTESLCATNNYAYQTWCHMMQDACKHGVLLEVKHAGSCQGKLTVSFISCRSISNFPLNWLNCWRKFSNFPVIDFLFKCWWRIKKIMVIDFLDFFFFKKIFKSSGKLIFSFKCEGGFQIFYILLLNISRIFRRIANLFHSLLCDVFGYCHLNVKGTKSYIIDTSFIKVECQ